MIHDKDFKPLQSLTLFVHILYCRSKCNGNFTRTLCSGNYLIKPEELRTLVITWMKHPIILYTLIY